MAEPARSEVHADPDVVLLVAKEVDVVINRSDGAELRARHFLEGADISRAPRLVIVEERMLDALIVLAAEPERDLAADVARDGWHARLDVVVGQIEARRHVAAGDVEAHAADRDVLLIRDDAAHRLGVSKVAVGAEDALGGRAHAHARPQLLDGLFIMLAEHFDHGTLLIDWIDGHPLFRRRVFFWCARKDSNLHHPDPATELLPGEFLGWSRA